MKKIIIELTDEQYVEMKDHIEKGHILNFENETFSGFGINLNTCELGEVHWNIE
jgi:hypothetical protein